jgi:DNA repair protein RecO (recombination protein O)
MPRYECTEGFCLRRLDYSNTSQVATFLTPDLGRLSFIAKGATRAPKKGIRLRFELMERYEIVFTRPRAGSLLNLTERSLVESFRDARSALERMLCTYYAAELVLAFTAEADPCPDLYDALARAMRRVAAGDGLGLSMLELELAVLREQGECPSFAECGQCGGAPGGRAVLSPAQGFTLCAPCARRVRGTPFNPLLPAPAGALHLLASLAQRPAADPSEANAVPADIVKAGRVLRFHMRFLLGRDLRMWRYLQEQHLSKALNGIRRSAGLPGGKAGAPGSGDQ